jgi:hypothetical protein
MIISSIIKRYLNTHDSPLNIIMTHCDNRYFEQFLRNILPSGSNILNLEDSLFGNNIPDMIICNNKINHLDKCGNLSYFLHCPILIIDHDIKPSFIDKDIIEYQSNSVYSLALNADIYNSWGKIHNLILGFNLSDQQSVEKWRNLLYQISKIPFNLKPKVYINDNQSNTNQ